jgi:hypothetical protein
MADPKVAAKQPVQIDQCLRTIWTIIPQVNCRY